MQETTREEERESFVPHQFTYFDLIVHDPSKGEHDRRGLVSCFANRGSYPWHQSTYWLFLLELARGLFLVYARPRRKFPIRDGRAPYAPHHGSKRAERIGICLLRTIGRNRSCRFSFRQYLKYCICSKKDFAKY